MPYKALILLDRSRIDGGCQNKRLEASCDNEWAKWARKGNNGVASYSAQQRIARRDVSNELMMALRFMLACNRYSGSYMYPISRLLRIIRIHDLFLSLLSCWPKWVTGGAHGPEFWYEPDVDGLSICERSSQMW